MMEKLSKHKKLVLITVSIVVCVSFIIVLCVFWANKSYSVKFYSDNKELLKIDTVKSGESANPPVEPELSYGSIFQKWDTDFSAVTKDMEINPEFESVNGKENVFALAGAYGKKDDVVTTSLTLCGDVMLSGFDITLEYDEDELQFDSVFGNDENVIYNEKKPGKINLNYVSAKNTTADVDICSFKFKITGKQKTIPLTIKVNKVYANKGNDLFTPHYSVIDANVYAY